MSADRVGWPTHKAKARRSLTAHRREIKVARAARKLEQQKAPR